MVAVVAESEAGPLLSDQAYLAIRDLIVTLELPPGAIVSEADLMNRLAMGRTPVREALRALARERLIDVYPRRGMFVAGVDARDLASLSEARAVLEPAAARLAARRLTESDKAMLDELLAELDALGSTPDERDLITLDRRLHRFELHAIDHPASEGSDFQ